MRFPLAALLPLLLASHAAAWGGRPKAGDTGGGAAAARQLFVDWVAASAVPGTYTTAAERLSKSEHPGDLTNTLIFSTGRCGVADVDCHGGPPQWPHTKPNPIFTEAKGWKASRRRMVEGAAWLLRRGMSRLQDTVLSMLEAMAAAGEERDVDTLLVLARRALNSYEDFWRQLTWTVAYGPRQVENHIREEMKEYVGRWWGGGGGGGWGGGGGTMGV